MNFNLKRGIPICRCPLNLWLIKDDRLSLLIQYTCRNSSNCWNLCLQNIHWDLCPQWSVKGWMGTVVNRGLSSLFGRSREILLTIPFINLNFLLQHLWGVYGAVWEAKWFYRLCKTSEQSDQSNPVRHFNSNIYKLSQEDVYEASRSGESNSNQKFKSFEKINFYYVYQKYLYRKIRN